MAHSVVLVCVVLGLAALPGGLTSEHEFAASEVIRETEGHLGLVHRFRRDLQKEFDWFIQPNKTWCFCGKESWLKSVVRANLEESAKCVRESKLNLTAIRGKEVSSVIKTVGKASRCAYDCIFQKLNLIDSEGNLKKTDVTEFFKDKVFLDDDIKEIGSTVVNRCLTSGTANTLTLKVILSHGEGAPCGEEAKKFISCLLLEMVQDCTESLKRRDVDHCETVYRNFAITRKASHSSYFP